MRKLTFLQLALGSLTVVGQAASTEGFWEQPEGVIGHTPIQARPRVPDGALMDLSQLVERFQSLVSVKTSYLVSPSPPERLKDPRLEGEARRILSSVYSSSLFEGKLLGEGEIAYSAPVSNSAEGAGDPQHRMVRLGLTGTEGAFRYGVTYRSAGKAFTSFQDQAMREVWGEWQMGFARLRTSLGEQWNNLDQDPMRSRLMQVHEKLSLQLTPPSWPALSLSYARGSISSSLEPVGVVPQWMSTETLDTSLSYARSSWSAKITSTYVLSRDQLHSGIDTVSLAHVFSGSYRLVNGLTITQSLGFREEQQRWSGVRVETPLSALSLVYAPDKNFNLTASGSYSSSQSSDGLINSQAFSAKGVLSWTVQRSSTVRTTLSFEPSYRNNIDVIHRAYSVEDLSGLVRLQLAGF